MVDDATAAVVALPRVTATRYVEPLREGGSLPALMEADDLGTYVVKFIGAGQGRLALVAELVVGELAQRLGIRVPKLVMIDVAEAFGRREPDPEIQQLLLDSAGVNLGMDYLPRSIGYSGQNSIDADAAASILWLDALTVNVDRSWRNPNLLIWHGDLWAIDHGASLLFQHIWPDIAAFRTRPYSVDDHVLAAYVGRLPKVHAALAPQVTPDVVADILRLVPDDWLPGPGRGFRDRQTAEMTELPDANAVRALYAEYLVNRAASDSWVPRGES